MKKYPLFIPLALSALLALSAAGCTPAQTSNPPAAQTAAPTQTPAATAAAAAQPSADAEQEIARLVEDFGKKLQSVSLLAPADEVGKRMNEHYAAYVAPALLTKWQKEPAFALGQLSAGTTVEGIEIKAIEQASGEDFTVTGFIVENASGDAQTDAQQNKRPVSLRVQKINGSWMITDSLLIGAQGGGVLYENADYGFTLKLPESWQGFTVVADDWQGAEPGGNVTQTGPLVLIRHPLWTKENPRQDIPVMVFTLAQWDDVQQEKLSVSAAPVPPGELGRSDKYVFALPARYNFAYLPGNEEVEAILAGHPLTPMSDLGC